MVWSRLVDGGQVILNVGAKSGVVFKGTGVDDV